MRDDAHALGPEQLVAVGMVEMPVRVDDDVDVAAADLTDGGLVLRRDLRELIVDQQHPFVTDACEDIAGNHAFPFPEQDIQPTADVLCHDPRIGEILRLHGGRRAAPEDSRNDR